MQNSKADKDKQLGKTRPLQAKKTGKSMAPPPFQLKAGPDHSGGSQMGGEVLQKMEGSFGTDFSGVKIHQNSGAATDVGAKAFTQGDNVHFAPGQYNPGSKSGQELIGHELSHVVQQRKGNIPMTKTAAGMPVNDDPSLENEADKMGAMAAEGKSIGATKGAPVQQKSADKPIQGFQLSEEDAENYPRLKRYLQHRIQDILDNAHIMRGLLRYGQLSREDVERAVQWGSGPTISVQQLGETTNGSFSPNINSSELRIDLELVEQLQNANAGDLNAALLLVGSTVLHEFTHYGDDQDGVDYTEGHGEEGQAFEEYTYGRDIDNMQDAREVIEEYRNRRRN